MSLSSDISNKNDNLFSSDFFESGSLHSIKSGEPDNTFNKIYNEPNFKLNNASDLETSLAKGPFRKFIDGSHKFDFLGKKDFNIIGYGHPVCSTYKLNTNISMDEFFRPLHEHESLSFNFSCSTQKESFNYVVQKLGFKNTLTFENSFASTLFSEGNIQFLPRSAPLDQLISRIDSLPVIPNTIFCLDFQNEKTFNFKELGFYRDIAKYIKAKGIPIWINESFGFGRMKTLLKSNAKDFSITPEVLTFGAEPLSYHVHSSIINDASEVKLNEKAVQLSQNMVNYLELGKFWGPNGRIAKIEDQFKKQLKSLVIQFPDLELRFQISGNLFHLSILNENIAKTIELSRLLFDNGVLAGLQKSHAKWLRFKLPTSLKDGHILQIAQLIEKSLKQLT